MATELTKKNLFKSIPKHWTIIGETNGGTNGRKSASGFFQIHLFALVSTLVQVVSFVIMSSVAITTLIYLIVIHVFDNALKWFFRFRRTYARALYFGQIACFNLINFAPNIMTIIQRTNFFRLRNDMRNMCTGFIRSPWKTVD